MTENKEKKDFVFAVFLIFVGIIFLLNTTGLIGWGIWEYILRFWPIFLILGGIKLIFHQSIVTEIVLTIVAIFLFLSISIFSYISYTASNLPFLPSNVNDYILNKSEQFSLNLGPTVEEEAYISSDAYSDITERVLDLQIEASEFLINDDFENDNYLTLNSQYTKNYIEPSLSSEKLNSTLNIAFETLSPRNFWSWHTRQTSFDFCVGKTDLQTDLNIVLGAGEGTVDLKNLNIDSFSAEVGAGELTSSFAKDSLPSNISIEIGAGAMVLNIPKGTEYKVSYDLGVGSIEIDDEEIARSLGTEGTYQTAGYESAESRLDVITKVGVGSLEINNI